MSIWQVQERTVGCYESFCAGMTVETHGGGVGWDNDNGTWTWTWDVRRTPAIWQAGDVIINLVYFVPHPISKIN
jgi:hypothetical protein